jgi:hypothetical protein
MGALVELLLSVVFAVALGAAFTMTTSAATGFEFSVARAFFVLAAIAAMTAYLVWRAKWRSRAISSLSTEIGFGVLAACLVFVGLPASLYWIHARELKTLSNFPYLRALLNEDRTLKERILFVENAKSVPIQNVEIVFQDVADPWIRHVFRAIILYQDGTWFVPAGDPHTLRIGPGQYIATINSLDGAFTEYLSLKMDSGGTLKQKIEVFKSLPRGQGGLEDLLLHEEE